MHNDKVMQNRSFKFSLSQNTIRKMQKVNMSCFETNWLRNDRLCVPKNFNFQF